jgi:S-formylglutathione hydrolase FrmB
MGWAWRVVLVAVVATGALVAPRPAGAQTEVHGLTLVQDEVLSDDGRLHELTLHSDALGRETRVRVLLPAAYDSPAAAGERYPLLLLLHGAGGDQRDWTVASDVEGHTAGLGLIVVMPDGGRNSFYSDWLDGPQWETHILDEVVPWVEATYRAVGTREGRAVAGLSMGGFGSMSYAARHPDRFVAAAAFSGGVAIADLGIVEAAALQALGLGDDRRWGPFLTEEANWRGHNPADLVGNLRWTSVRLATGNGVPCPGDRPESGILEAGVWSMNLWFGTRLTLVGAPHSIELRPCGTHEWHYWDRDIAVWLPMLMGTFAAPPPPPAVFDYRITDPRFTVWGWTFDAHRLATEFLELKAVSPAGLTATGSGPVDVVTAPAYEPGATYAITGNLAGVVTVPVAVVPPLLPVPPGTGSAATAVADAGGRLAFTLDLGPAHVADQYSPDGIAAEALGLGSYFRTATVSITKTAAAVPTASSAPTPTSVRPGASPHLPITGAPAPAWPFVAAVVAVAAALRHLARPRLLH